MPAQHTMHQRRPFKQVALCGSRACWTGPSTTVQQQSTLDQTKVGTAPCPFTQKRRCAGVERAGPAQGRHRAVSVHTSITVQQQSTLDQPKVGTAPCPFTQKRRCAGAERAGPAQGRHRAVSVHTSITVRQQSTLDQPKVGTAPCPFTQKRRCAGAERAGPAQGRHRAVSVHTKASLCGSGARSGSQFLPPGLVLSPAHEHGSQLAAWELDHSIQSLGS